MGTQDRVEILDRLAAGEISAQEALALLERTAEPSQAPIEQVGFTRESSDELRFSADEIDQLKAIESDAMPAGSSKASRKAEKVGSDPAETAWDEYPIQGNGQKPRWLRIRVRNLDTGRDKVSINMPLGLVTFGLRIARRFDADLGELDVDEMMAMVKQGERGLLVDVQDEEDQEHVQIYLD